MDRKIHGGNNVWSRAQRKVRWEFYYGEEDPWWEQCVEYSSKEGEMGIFLWTGRSMVGEMCGVQLKGR